MPMRLLLAALALAALPAFAQDEVPFVVTPDNVTLAMLQLAGVGPQDHVIDLGSGDGRIVITAAKRFGASGLGVEIVPDLVRQSQDNARRAGVAARVDFRTQDLFETDLARASVITMYLLPDVNLQLRDRLLALAPGTRIVSHDWDMGDWLPDRTLTLDVPDKPIGREKLSRVHLWVVPAPVHGHWCTAGGALRIVQRFQAFSASVTVGANPVPAMVFDGRIDGRALAAGGRHLAHLRADGERLQLLQVAAPLAALQGRVFTRAVDGRCAG
jgi:SAM-dependent methyltransferase